MRRVDKSSCYLRGAGLLCFFNSFRRTLSCTVFCLVIFIVQPFFAVAQTAIFVEQTSSVKRGLVVESVAKGLDAETAGVKPGDILVGWKGKVGSGNFESPFDLPYIWYEQASRGPVTIEGIRNHRRRAWLLGGNTWGISTRPNFSGNLRSVYERAQALAAADNLDEAVNLFRTAATTGPSGNPPWLPAWFLSRAGQALSRAKAWSLADKAYGDAVKESQALGPEIRAEIFRQWADRFASRDDLTDAKRLRRDALHEWEMLGSDTVAVADTLLSIAEIELREGNFEEAAASLQRSMTIGDKIAPAGIQAIVTSVNFAVLYQDRGELDKAERYYLKALHKEERRFPRSSLIVQTLSDLGVLFDQKGDLAQAERYHRRALAIARQLDPGSLTVADVLSSLAECVLQRGDLRHAEQFHKEALSIRERQRPGDLSCAYDLAGLGRVARLRGQLGRAEEDYRQALEISQKVDAPERDRASFLIGLAAVFRKKRDFPKAEQLYRQALTIIARVDPDSVDRADTLGELAGTLYEDHQVKPAMEIYREALDRAEDQAEQLGGMEEERPLYRSQHVRFYQEYMSALIDQGQLQQAFELLESSHARTLLEMLSQSHVDIDRGAPLTLIARERELRQVLSQRAEARIGESSDQGQRSQSVKSHADLGGLLEEYQQIQAQIRETSPAYAALARPVTISLKAIQNLLDPDTVLMEYSLGDDKSWLWAVTNKSLTVYALPKRTLIDGVARRVYRLLTSPNLQAGNASMIRQAAAKREYIAQSTKLSNLVLSSVTALLKSTKRLVVVADGALQYIPFSALPDPGKRGYALPLILNHEVVNLPSASILAELRRQAAGRRRPPKAVAILADPVFDRNDERLEAGVARGNSSPELSRQARDLRRSANDVGLTRDGNTYLSRLLYTRKEAEAVMAVTPPGAGMLALDFAANRQTATSRALANYRIVHFATHGILDNQHPELSGLVLSLVDAKGRAQNGFLNLQDIYNLKLPVDLVVLSGCQTALGEQIQGEGLIGLTRGFMYAGASRVVASLWSVSDIATSRLMARFYRGMEQDHMRPAAALRAAQIKMWKEKQWRAPYFWAAFEIQGDWR